MEKFESLLGAQEFINHDGLFLLQEIYFPYSCHSGTSQQTDMYISSTSMWYLPLGVLLGHQIGLLQSSLHPSSLYN